MFLSKIMFYSEVKEGNVESTVNVLYEGVQLVEGTFPFYKYIVNLPPPQGDLKMEGVRRGIINEFPFPKAHYQTGIGLREGTAHTHALALKKEGAGILKEVLG